MNKAISVAVIVLGSLMLLAAQGKIQPLNVKTGVWQMSQTVTWTGLPPELARTMKNGATNNYKACVRAKDLSSNPWAEGTNDKCNWTVVHSNGTDMEVRGTGCDFGKEFGMDADVHGTIHVVDSENGTGSFSITLTGNGQTMHGHAAYTGKWVAASCPANLN